MPAANPFSPLLEVGGGATIGPASANGSLKLDDHHATAGVTLLAIVILALLWKGRFRFSTKVG